MPDARIVTFAVPVETSPVTTHFQIRFNTDGGTTWTGYDPVNATPGSTPADVSVSTLDASNNYSLDGINSPTGNEAAASNEGNWYELRLKSSGGYGSWSDLFKIAAEPDTDGPMADIADLIADFSVIADGEPAGAQSGWAYADNQARDRALGRLLTDAMDEMRARSSVDAFYTGTSTTNGQRRALARVERYWAVADALARPATMKALGIHEPLLMEDSTDITALSEHYRARGEALLDTLLGDTSPGSAFALPSVSSSTFVYSSSDRSPYDRNRLMDETDNLSSSDLVNG